MSTSTQFQPSELFSNNDSHLSSNVGHFTGANGSSRILLHKQMAQWKLIREGMTRDEANLKIERLPILENQIPFDCQICMVENVGTSEGVIFKTCGHLFCKTCLVNYISSCEVANISCPFVDNNTHRCLKSILPSEVEALVHPDEYRKLTQRYIQETESAIPNTFHCLTPDCTGFCIQEDASYQYFRCPVCSASNCMRCKVIHGNWTTCSEFQKKYIKPNHQQNEQRGQDFIQELLNNGTYMRCPKCSYVIEKNGGCENMTCKQCRHNFVWGNSNSGSNTSCVIV